jgi:thiol-activated cytolysin
VAHLARSLLGALARMKSTLALVLLVSACTTDIVMSESSLIDDYIESLPYLPVEDAQIVEGSRSSDTREGDYQCSTQNLQETRQYDRIVAYAANSDSLYPGGIVSADSVLSGLFTQIVLPRAPATISVSLENLGGSKTAVIENPSLSAYRDALAGILDAEITGATPANLYSEIEEVHTQTQLDMALGIQASWGLGVASLRTSFDWSQQSVRSRFLVRYTQAYYTVDLDAPGAPSELFAPTVRLADVQGKMDETRPPVYVSSVTYGRMVVFTFESEYSSEEMSAALGFAYSGGVDVSGDVSVTYKDIISKSRITAFILGGDAGSAAHTIDSYEALIAFIKEGGNYSRQSPGAPIAYKLSYLKDNSPARMSFTTDYTVKECVRVSQKIRVRLNSIVVESAGGDAGSDLEIYGRLWAEGVNTATLFDKNSDNWVRIREGTQFGSAGSPIGEAIIDVAPRGGEVIRLRGDLKESDTFFNDNLGNETVLNPFETGWRKDVSMMFTGSGARVRVDFSLAPI